MSFWTLYNSLWVYPHDCVPPRSKIYIQVVRTCREYKHFTFWALDFKHRPLFYVRCAVHPIRSLCKNISHRATIWRGLYSYLHSVEERFCAPTSRTHSHTLSPRAMVSSCQGCPDRVRAYERKGVAYELLIAIGCVLVFPNCQPCSIKLLSSLDFVWHKSMCYWLDQKRSCLLSMANLYNGQNILPIVFANFFQFFS